MRRCSSTPSTGQHTGRATTDEEISGFLIATLFAGQHTSSITSSWTGFCMLTNKVSLTPTITSPCLQGLPTRQVSTASSTLGPIHQAPVTMASVRPLSPVPAYCSQSTVYVRVHSALACVSTVSLHSCY